MEICGIRRMEIKKYVRRRLMQFIYIYPEGAEMALAKHKEMFPRNKQEKIVHTYGTRVLLSMNYDEWLLFKEATNINALNK